MDDEFRQYLREMETRLGERVGLAETRLSRRVDGLELRLDRLDAIFSERTERVETNLLSAFHGWARSMEIRVRGTSVAVTGFEERLALLENRVSELERKAS